MSVRSRIVFSFTAFAAMASLSCGGGDEASLAPQSPTKLPTGGASVAVTPSAGASVTPELPGTTPPWVPPGTLTCPLGNGDAHAVCLPNDGAPVFLAQVDAAINELIQTHPELFDLTRVVGENGYLVLDSDKFYLEMANLLQTRPGLCAGWDLKELQVRNSNGFSEQYDLVLSNGHMRRGEGSFRSTCTPASFPLAPADRIDSVRVAFYSILCEDGRTPPRNGESRLPVECTGFVTATPKDKEGRDVDTRFHGPYVTWELEQVDDYVFMEDFPGVDFNKFLRGLDPGRFNLCATVQTKKGCLYGTVSDKSEDATAR